MENLQDAMEVLAQKQKEEKENESTIAARFTNSTLSSKYVFKNGSEANFIGGVYITKDPKEFLELMEEIRLGHPTIGQELGNEFVDLKFVDPLEKVKAQAIADYIASQQRATDGSLDAGDSQFTGKIEGIANTATVAAAMGGSSSGATDQQGTVISTTGETTNTASIAPSGLAALAAKAAAAKASS